MGSIPSELSDYLVLLPIKCKSSQDWKIFNYFSKAMHIAASHQLLKHDSLHLMHGAFALLSML